MFSLESATLLAIVFLVLFFQKLTTLVGKGNISDWAWYGYRKYAVSIGDAEISSLAAKSKELNEVNKEKKSISAQDEYARWTKLNRKSDQLTNELKTLNEQLILKKSVLTKYVNFIIMLTTTIPLWFIRYWYRKTVLFYLPKGVFPPLIEWFLALPFTQVGGIGLTVYIFSVNSVLSDLFFLLSFPFSKSVDEPEEPLKNEIPIGEKD